jgi:hypothetical protein
VRGTLNVTDCWSGAFDLQPDFFSAVPYRQSLELRIQNGGDYETFSDGVVIQMDDIAPIRPSNTGAGLYGVPLEVSLPAGVSPPGVPITPNPNPASVHLTLYLNRSCRTENPALYAVESVTLNADGNCDPRDEAGAPAPACGPAPGIAPPGDAGVDATIAPAPLPPGAEAGVPATDAGAAGPVGHSEITLTALFDGDPAEVSAAQRRNTGTFHVYLADPREICPGGLGPPPPCRGELTGNFDFFFERGRPAQPFP